MKLAKAVYTQTKQLMEYNISNKFPFTVYTMTKREVTGKEVA